jgi:anaphase-promoting complex subunit 7
VIPILAFQLRGELLLGMGKAEHAIVAYFQANNYAKDLASYKGLVGAYLTTKKYKEALCTAKEAVATLPNNPAAIALVGKVLATSPEGADKAKRAFAKALSIDRSCTDAALALVDLHVGRREYAEATDLLLHSLQSLNHDFLHTKLADVYVLNEQYSDALAYYHAAISLNPTSDAALAGIDRLEKLMHGVDPDLDDDDADAADRTANSAEGDEVLDSTAYL